MASLYGISREKDSSRSRNAQAYRLGGLDAIHPGRENTSRVASPLARRVQPAHVERAEILATGDAQWRGRAGFHPGEHRIRPVETLDLAAEGGQRLADGGDG